MQTTLQKEAPTPKITPSSTHTIVVHRESVLSVLELDHRAPDMMDQVQGFSTQTPPTTPSSTHTVVVRRKAVPPVVKPDLGVPEETEQGREVEFGAHQAPDVNTAILDCVKTLLLEELSGVECEPTAAINRQLGIQSVEQEYGSHDRSKPPTTTLDTLSLSSASSDSSWSFACCDARRIERDHAQLKYDDPTNLSRKSTTLSLASSSDSGWSFTCRSARRVEREFAQDNGREEQTTTDHHGVRLPHGENVSLPVQDKVIAPAPQPEQPRATPKQSAVFCGLFVGIPEQAEFHLPYSAMSDEEFAALPDWSDVEDDPEYNVCDDEPFCWSSTASSHSSLDAEVSIQIVYPAVHVPTGYTEAAATDKSEKWW